MIMLKSGHFKPGAPSSKQRGGCDFPESGERVKKRLKHTGHSLKSRFKRMRKEEAETVESALDTSKTVVDQVTEERADSPPPMKMCPLKKKDVPCSEETSDSGRDLVLGKDRYPIPLKQKVKVENQSAGRDADISVEDVEKKCVKRRKNLVKKQKGQIEEFHRRWEGIFSKLEVDYKLEAAIIRSIYLDPKTKVTDKLENLESVFAKKRAAKNLDKDMELKELEAEQLAARNEEIRKADIWLAEAKARISGGLDGSSKAQTSGSHNEETSSEFESKMHIGSKDIVPSIQKHGENIVSDCGNDEDVARNNPSIELKISPRKEGKIGLETNGAGISTSDAQKPDISQPKHSGDIPSELPETFAEEIVNDTNPLNMSTNTLIEGIANILIEGIAEVDAMDLPDADNSGRHERISPASGESVLQDVQSVEQHGDVPSDLPETAANDNMDVDDVQSVELHGDVPLELPETVTNENLDIDDVQSLELHEDLTSELPESVANEDLDIDDVELVEMLPETVANENLDNANMMCSSNQTPNALLGKGDAIDSPDDEHKGPTEPAERVANEVVDIVDPEELSAKLSVEGFGEARTHHLSDASLSRSDETDRTTVDVHVSNGQVLETSEQTETFQHPSPLLPLQVQEVQDVESVAVQVHDAGTINSSPSEIIVSKLVANSKSNIEQQACEEPATETQSSSTLATSTIIGTVITEQSSIKSHDSDESIAKDQVASQIEVVDLDIVDTATPDSALEVVDTAETLQSGNELQEQVEPAMETQSMSRIEVTVSQNLSNAVEQVEDASTAVNDVSLEIDVSNAGRTDNSTPVQSHIDATPTESISRLPLTDLSEAVETVELSDDPLSQLMDDVLRLINQSSPVTSVQTLASSQNYVAAEGVSQLPSHQADALNPPSLIPDPLMYELERNQREALALRTSHQEMLSSLKPECEKELEEAVAQIRRKYKLKEDEAIAQYTRKNDELYQSRKKIVMNKWLADAFRFKCLSTSDWPLPQQGSSASSMQGHQQFVRPTAPDPQISCVIGQSLHQASVPHAPTSTLVTSRNGQTMQQAPVIHATRPAPTTNQNSAAQSVPHATGRNPVTGRNGQPMQQVPHATMLEPFLNQNFAAQSVQAAQQAPSTISNLRGMNSALSTAVTQFGENFQSSPFLPASTPAAASSMSATIYMQNLWNHRQQQQLLMQQQILAAQQWPSNSQNLQHLGYPPSLLHHNLNPLHVLAQNHQNHGNVQGNWNSCGGTTTAIYLSDDD